MLLEAVSWGGLDNLFIPLGGFVLLKTYLPMDVPHLAACLAVTVILVALVLFWRRRMTLSDSAHAGRFARRRCLLGAWGMAVDDRPPTGSVLSLVSFYLI
jgi:hypothetical protein